MHPFNLALNLKEMSTTYLNVTFDMINISNFFLEIIVNLLLSIALFSFVRIIQISAKISIRFEVLLFIKRAKP